MKLTALICILVGFPFLSLHCQNLNINNQVITSGAPTFYSPGAIQSPDTSIHPVQISSATQVTFIAGQSVELRQGFSVDNLSSSGNFTAYLDTVAPSACPIPVITGDHLFCSGSSTNLSASSSLSGGGIITAYQWQLNGENIPGATAMNFAATAVGNYTLVITNSVNCSVISQIFTVSNYSATIGTIAGQTTQCVANGPGGSVFSIPAVAGATSYNWNAPSGLTIIGGQGTSSITVSWTSNASSIGITGLLCVNVATVCGVIQSCVPIDIQRVKPVQPNTISGPAKICPGDVANYSVAVVPRASSYTWAVPVGITITSGLETNMISVSTDASFTGGTVSVTANNVCGISTARTRTVILNSATTPGTISGQAGGLCNTTGIMYSIAAVPNVTSYIWSTAIAGVTVNGNPLPYSTTSTNVMINFGTFTSGSLTVAAANGCGASAARVLNITGTPGQPGSIAGNTTVCTNGDYTYSVATVTGATSYTWTVPNGSLVTNGQGSKIASVTFGSIPVNNMTVSVKASNACGTSASRLLNGISIITCPRFGDISSTNGSYQNLDVYPNPAHDELNVHFSCNEEDRYTLQLMDVTGRVVMDTKGTGTGDEVHQLLDVRNLAKGVYMIQLETKNGVEKTKVIVQ